MGSFLRIAGTFLALAIGCVGNALSATTPFPDRPIRLIVPFVPGGAADVVARRLVPGVSTRLGQTLVIDNRAGAGGILASELTAKAAPDGYTLLLVTPSHTANPALYKKLSYDTQKDFVAVTLICDAAGLFVVHPSVPANTIKEFIGYARSHPGALSYASPGSGTFPHLTTEMLKRKAGIDVMHIPYKGAAPAMTDLIAGVVQAKVDAYITANTHIKSGRIKLLAVTSKARVPQYADIPTIAEAGYPGFETTYWIGIVAPAGVPRQILAKIEAAFIGAVKEKEVAERLGVDGMRVIGSSAAELDHLMAAEFPQWRQVVKEAGITPE